MIKDTLLVPIFDLFILWVVVRNDLCSRELSSKVVDNGGQLKTLVSSVDELLVLLKTNNKDTQHFRLGLPCRETPIRGSTEL